MDHEHEDKGNPLAEHKLYRVVKARQLFFQGKWLNMSQIQQKFPHLMRELDEMGTLTQHIGGHRWPPTSSIDSTWLSIFVFFFSIVFQVLNF